jgi:hypothetical protein
MDEAHMYERPGGCEVPHHYEMVAKSSTRVDPSSLRIKPTPKVVSRTTKPWLVIQVLVTSFIALLALCGLIVATVAYLNNEGDILGYGDAQLASGQPRINSDILSDMQTQINELARGLNITKSQLMEVTNLTRGKYINCRVVIMAMHAWVGNAKFTSNVAVNRLGFTS